MKKINLLFISAISAIILFFVLTFIQSKIVNHEEMGEVYISNIDVCRDSEIKPDDYKKIIVPSFLIKNTDAIIDVNDLYGKYARESINKGQIIYKQDVATKDELKIINNKEGLEKIAIKIKSGENAVAYQIKPKDRVHVYFTGKSNVVNSILSKYGKSVDSDETAIETSKIIEDVEILGIYDESGRSNENSSFEKLDTIVIAVEPLVAEMIANLRNQGTFDITR